MEGMSDRYCSEQFGVPQSRMDKAIKGDFTEEVNSLNKALGQV